MAYRFASIHLKCCRTLAVRSNFATETSKCAYSLLLACEPWRHLCDNRGFSTTHIGYERATSDSSGIVNNDTNRMNENQDENHARTQVSWSVRKMRKSLRDLHGIGSVSSDQTVPGTGESQLHVVSSADELDVDGGSYSASTDVEPVDHRNVLEKFPFLDKKGSSKKYERVMETHYGIVRLDNKQSKVMKKNKDMSSANTQSQMSTSIGDSNVNYFDEKYFGDLSKSETGMKFEGKLIEDQSPSNISTVDEQKHFLTDSITLDNEMVQNNLFEEQYFSEVTSSETDTNTNTIPLHNHDNAKNVENQNTHDLTHLATGNGEFSLSNSEVSTKYLRKEDDFHAKQPGDAVSGDRFSMEENIFDEQYFGNSSPEPLESAPDNTTYGNTESNNHSANLESQRIVDVNLSTAPKISKIEKPSSVTESYDFTTDADSLKQEYVETKDIYIETITRQEKRQKSVKKANVEDPKTAYDMAMKIRLERKEKHGSESDDKLPNQEQAVPREAKWTGQKDTHGFRILSNQVLDIQNMPTSIVVNILKDSILYEDDSLIAIDKPYGLPSHGGPGVHNSVGQLLVPLAQRINKPELDLQLVHRLDKETTGVMLLAKHLQAHHILRGMFKKRQILKKYWVLTKGIPNPTQGVIDIPMSEGIVGEKHRMTLRPRYSAENKLMLKTEVSRRNTTTEAVTNYKVLDSNHSCALVECQPETGLKHQLRCHLSFALNTPILGDHKYSHFSKLAPQRLFPDILNRLGIRQSKVRHLPMHLHAVQLVLPEFRDGRNLFISARLPKHFVQNMKWLKISPP